MGYKIYLGGGYSDLMSFIDFASELDAFGVRKFSLTSLDGTNMTLNTRTATGAYDVFSALKGYITTFYENNDGKSIIVDVKLMCPEGQRQSVDPNGYYSSFFLNLYSSITVTYLEMSYAESGRELIEAPFISWCAYITQLHKKWQLYVES